jgi:hypothetical protein
MVHDVPAPGTGEHPQRTREAAYAMYPRRCEKFGRVGGGFSGSGGFPGGDGAKVLISRAVLCKRIGVSPHPGGGGTPAGHYQELHLHPDWRRVDGHRARRRRRGGNVGAIAGTVNHRDVVRGGVVPLTRLLLWWPSYSPVQLGAQV